MGTGENQIYYKFQVEILLVDMYYDCISKDFNIDTGTHKVVFNAIKVTLRLDIFKLQID